MVTSTGVWSVAPNVLSGRLFAPLWTTSVQREATVWSLCAGSCHPSDPWSALQQVVFVAEVHFVKCPALVNPWSFWLRMPVFFQFLHEESHIFAPKDLRLLFVVWPLCWWVVLDSLDMLCKFIVAWWHRFWLSTPGVVNGTGKFVSP